MREGTTSRVMVAVRSYGEFYDFYSVSPKYFLYTLVLILKWSKKIIPRDIAEMLARQFLVLG
jgi:hypothetical protein